MKKRTRYTRVQSAFLGALALSMMAGVASAQPAPASPAPAPAPPAPAAPAPAPPAPAAPAPAPTVAAQPGAPLRCPRETVVQLGASGIYTLPLYRCEMKVAGRSFPGLVAWESAMVEGLGSFVADRAQQEVIQWFVDTMLEDLCQEEGAALFKKLCDLKKAVKGAALPSRAAVIAALRADVELLPARLLETLEPKGGKDWGLALVHIFEGMRAGKSPHALVAGVADLEKIKGEKIKPCDKGPGVKCTLTVVSVVMQAYIETVSVQRVGYEATFTELSNTKLGEIGFVGRLQPAETETLFAKLERATKVLNDLASRSAVLSPADTEFKQAQLLAVASDSARVVASAMSDIADAVKLPDPSPRASKRSTEASKRSTEAFKRSTEALKWSTEALAALVAGKYEEALAPTAELVALAAKNPKLPRAVQRYIPLAMDLARAKTSDDVKTALEAAAEPVGGWRLKRNGFVASVGALAGASAGWEFSLNNDTKLRQSGFVGSVFAPVGFDLSWPVGKNNGSTLGFFVSVLDVGNVVGARFAGEKADDVEEVEAAPVIGFPQVFSPGLYVRAGLGHSPFVLAAGVSWAPQLRRLTLTDGTTEEINAARVYLGLAADVTLFPF